MNTRDVSETLTTLFSELVDGAHRRDTYMLNVGDEGLLASLDKLSADAASRTHAGGASIAAHVDHLRYGLSLMSRWHGGEENPWRDADWTASWRKTNVAEAEWGRLRAELRQEAHRFLESLAAPRELNERQLTVLVSNIPHVAYHLGAIRQMDRALRGPTAEEEVAAKKAR